MNRRRMPLIAPEIRERLAARALRNPKTSTPSGSETWLTNPSLEGRASCLLCGKQFDANMLLRHQCAAMRKMVAIKALLSKRKRRAAKTKAMVTEFKTLRKGQRLGYSKAAIAQYKLKVNRQKPLNGGLCTGK